MKTLTDKSKEIRELKQEILAEIRRLLRPKRLFTIEDAGHYLGIAPKTIRNSLGPKAKTAFPIQSVRHGGRVLFRKEDLDSYIDSL
jgi:hypothetical protein